MHSSQQWELAPQSPDWLHAALGMEGAPARGGHSIVFDLNEHEVVKLAWEPGAVAYLEMCAKARGYLPHLPRVTDVAHWVATERSSGLQYCAFRMERLAHDFAACEPLAARYRARAAGVEDNDCQVQRSQLALTSVADELSGLQGFRALASCLLFLADELASRNWVTDLGDSANWMRRPDGTVVLADPVHEAH